MSSTVLVVFFALAAGLAVQVQSPLSSMLGQRLGPISSVFITHFGGTLAALLLLLVVGGEQIREWRGLPWYALAAGVLGVVVVGGVTYTIPRIGTAATTSLMVLAQLSFSAVVDHFGLLGTSVRPLEPARALGLAVLLLGVWLVTR